MQLLLPWYYYYCTQFVVEGVTCAKEKCEKQVIWSYGLSLEGKTPNLNNSSLRF